MDVNYGTGEVSLKIVYYGPGLSGKTTNLEVIHSKAPASNRGRLTAIATQQDRTLFFDFMPLELGKIGGLKTKLRLFTVPGQVFYNATRKLVLQRVDGLVFVADSQPHKLDENIESLENLEENLKEYGVNIRDIPLVLQYNKRDLPNIMSMKEMDDAINSELKVQSFPAVAVTGEGVFPTLKAIAGLVLKSVESLSKSSPSRAGKVAPLTPLPKKKFIPKMVEPLSPPKKEKPEEEKEGHPSIQRRGKGVQSDPGLLKPIKPDLPPQTTEEREDQKAGETNQPLASKLKKIVHSQEGNPQP